MNRQFYSQLADKSISQEPLAKGAAKEILLSKKIELMPLLNAAYEVRKKFVGKKVTIHIINNAQNGYCPEDCHYCAQAQSSQADIEEYPIKSDQEILAEAKNAYDKGAHRYCMVFAGRGPSQGRVEHLARLIRTIKSKYPIEICVSAGLLDENKAQILKSAGLDRLNHNLNTSKRHYSKICTTHTYEDRLKTLQAARQAGLQLCSGVILGMGEDNDDVLETAYTLRNLSLESIPINFFIPIQGAQLTEGLGNFSPAPHPEERSDEGSHEILRPFGPQNEGSNIKKDTTTPQLSPEYCLRVLCLYRFLNPQAEIRIAAGRELHLRSMEVMALYPANSLFLDGYLNAKGAERIRTFQMIKDAGFTIRSDHSLDELLANEIPSSQTNQEDQNTQTVLKDLKDLRPQYIQ